MDENNRALNLNEQAKALRNRKPPRAAPDQAAAAEDDAEDEWDAEIDFDPDQADDEWDGPATAPRTIAAAPRGWDAAVDSAWNIAPAQVDPGDWMTQEEMNNDTKSRMGGKRSKKRMGGKRSKKRKNRKLRKSRRR